MNCFTFPGALRAVFFLIKEILADKKWTNYIENIQENKCWAKRRPKPNLKI